MIDLRCGKRQKSRKVVSAKSKRWTFAARMSICAAARVGRGTMLLLIRESIVVALTSQCAVTKSPLSVFLLSR